MADFDINEYYFELMQDVERIAGSTYNYMEDSFFERSTEELIGAHELETADRVFYVSPRGDIRVDGYGGMPTEVEPVLSLIITDFNNSPNISTMSGADASTILTRLSRFLQRSIDPSFSDQLEETDQAAGLARTISQTWSKVKQVKFYLITNRSLSTRVDRMPSREIKDIPVDLNIWDIRRFYQHEISGREREELIVDMEKDFGGALPLLRASNSGSDYQGYLAVISGQQLADIYKRYTTRLLEKNVRVFLQARGKVNQGIRNTLSNNPNMFFAYNNGISTTAEEVQISNVNGTLSLMRMKNFQIVNGGQTTASIYNTMINNPDVDLSNVHIQMKLSVINQQPEGDGTFVYEDQIISDISKFANTQNRVLDSDFLSNHEFHRRIEENSRRIYSPPVGDSTIQTKWFYERAKGQYQDAESRTRKSSAQRRSFELEYPKSQKIAKTDLAKFLNIWENKPHIVSKGAQANFANFAEMIRKMWDANDKTFNDDFYRDSIAKAIIFNQMSAIVSQQPWYHGGYRANVVYYTLAKLSIDLKDKDYSLDFQKIWNSQSMSDNLKQILASVSEKVHDVLINPPGEIGRNVTEWAKTEACWTQVANLSIDWQWKLESEIITKEEQKTIRKSGIKDRQLLNDYECQLKIVEAGEKFWTEFKEWGSSRKLLSDTEISITDILLAMSHTGKTPTESQSVLLMETVQRLNQEGLPLTL